MDKIEQKYLQAVELIKKAILQSQYNAIRLANQEQLKLYFGIGRYISENSRNGFWGTGSRVSRICASSTRLGRPSKANRQPRLPIYKILKLKPL